MRRLRSESGFTLPELMVGMVLMMVVVSASLTTLEQFTLMGKRGERRVDMQEQARNSARQMSRSLRNVAGSSETADVIERAQSYDLVFKVVDESGTSYGSNDQRLKRVRYCLDSSTSSRGRIREQVQTWTTASTPAIPSGTSCPASSWGTSRVIADNVTNRAGGQNRPVWTYRVTDGQVSAVSVNLFMDDSLASEPKETALSTGVFLRNQNRPPLASFTATPAGVNHVLLNGSGSYDPEGHPLDMTWTVGGTEIGEGVNLDWNAGSAGLRTITLTVSDPSGLTDTMTQSVVVE
jgi:type II secretory pathway pseudopilin PulG